MPVLTFKTVARAVQATIRWKRWLDRPHGSTTLPQPFNMRAAGIAVCMLIRWKIIARNSAERRLLEVTAARQIPSGLVNRNSTLDFPNGSTSYTSYTTPSVATYPDVPCIGGYCSDHAQVGIVRSRIGRPLLCHKCESAILRNIMPLPFQISDRTFYDRSSDVDSEGQGTAI